MATKKPKARAKVRTFAHVGRESDPVSFHVAAFQARKHLDESVTPAWMTLDVERTGFSAVCEMTLADAKRLYELLGEKIAIAEKTEPCNRSACYECDRGRDGKQVA